LFIGHHRSVARDLQELGDLASGGDPLTGGEPSPEDLAAQRPVDLEIEAPGSVKLQHVGPLLSENTIVTPSDEPRKWTQEKGN
jgi:hypothetical protein